MICLYCDDVTSRSEYQHYFRDHGITVNAPPPAMFLQIANTAECRGAIFIGEYDPSVLASLRRSLPVFAIGQGDDPGIVYFASYDDPALIDALDLLSKNLFPFRCDHIIYCGEEKDDPVFIVGYPISLTSTEKTFLAYLVSNKDRDVSGEELLVFCVGDVHRSTGNVSQHISSINKKTEQITGRTLIISDKNGNYKLNPYA